MGKHSEEFRKALYVEQNLQRAVKLLREALDQGEIANSELGESYARLADLHIMLSTERGAPQDAGEHLDHAWSAAMRSSEHEIPPLHSFSTLILVAILGNHEGRVREALLRSKSISTAPELESRDEATRFLAGTLEFHMSLAHLALGESEQADEHFSRIAQLKDVVDMYSFSVLEPWGVGPTRRMIEALGGSGQPG